MITFHHGLKLAMNVYFAFASHVSDETNIIVEAYQNCREQGLAFWNLSMNKAVYVSNDRHSDCIVVYTGRISFRGLSEELYGTPFECHTIDDAVKYLRKTLCQS